MSWHEGTFFVALSLWTITVLFVVPEARDATHTAAASIQQQMFLTWRNVTVTLVCAAVMFVGYCKLRLYLDEMTDALAAGRTSLNPYNVDGVNVRNPNDAVADLNDVEECHDRTFELLTRYTEDLAETSARFRDAIKLLLDDINSWHADINIIVLQREFPKPTNFTAPPNASAQGARRTQSADVPVRGKDGSPTGQSGTPSPITFKLGESRPSKNRSRNSKFLTHTEQRSGTQTPHTRSPFGHMDRDVDEGEFANATRFRDPAATDSLTPASRTPLLGRSDGARNGPVFPERQTSSEFFRDPSSPTREPTKQGTEKESTASQSREEKVTSWEPSDVKPADKFRKGEESPSKRQIVPRLGDDRLSEVKATSWVDEGLPPDPPRRLISSDEKSFVGTIDTDEKMSLSPESQSKPKDEEAKPPVATNEVGAVETLESAKTEDAKLADEEKPPVSTKDSGSSDKPATGAQEDNAEFDEDRGYEG